MGNMYLPELTPSNELAIKKLTQYNEEKLDPMPFFNRYAAAFGRSLEDDPRYSEPLYWDFEDYDYLHDTSRLKPIYLNEFDFNIQEDREAIERLTRMEFTGNSFETVATCNPACGHYRGNYRLKQGKACPKCGEVPELFLDRGEDTRLWLKLPEGVNGFVNLGFFSTFFNKVGIGSPKVCVPRYFIDPTYRGQINKQKNTTVNLIRNMLEELEIIDVNMNTFQARCDDIMHWMLVGNGKRHCTTSHEGVVLMEVYQKNKHIAFSKYMKVPNRYATILEKTGKDTYAYPHQPVTAQLYTAIADTKRSNAVVKLSAADKRRNCEIVGKNLVKLADQYRKVNNPKALFGKPALNRKHVASGAVPFTGRSVVTSVTGILNPDEWMVPWKMCLAILDYHITGFLYRRGHTPYQAIQRISRAAYWIDPLIDEFFRDMEENNKAIIQSGRNPSIEFLSLRSAFLRVNRDLQDESIRVPILAVSESNTDFDGDNHYIVLMADNESKAKAYGAWGHHQTLDRNIPFTVGDYAGQAATNLMNLNTLMAQTPILDVA